MQALLLLAPLTLAGASVPATSTTSLERGLEAIHPDQIESDLNFIASDELKGRDTPSPGLRIAARYIRSRVERLGFTPAGEEGFFDLYSLDRVGIDLEKTEARFSGVELTFGEDYFFSSEGFKDFESKGEIVFVGNASEEDLAGLDLTGRVALAYDAPKTKSSARNRRLAAAGAVGFLLLQPEEVGYRRVNRMARYRKRQAERGSLRVRADGLSPIYLTEKGVERLELDLDKAKPGQAMKVLFEERRTLSGDPELNEVENVAALWPGSDPKLSKEVIIISAHYDHVGVGNDGEEIFNGADDNGSGTCGLLALADGLAQHGPMRRSVLLLWVSGEEKGLKGSYAWTTNPTLPEGYRAVANLNIDMIGRNAKDYLLITPTKERPEYNELVRMAEKNAPLEGFPELGSCDDYWSRSDHMNFSEHLGIPVAFLFSDVHEDYHRPTDTVEKIDYDKISRVARLVLRMLDGLQTDELFGN